jgi:sialate O-acetylesterase
LINAIYDEKNHKGMKSTNIKMYSKRLIFVFSFLLSVTVYCQVRLPRLISNGMVLQRDTKVKIWGRAAKNEEIAISFIDSTYLTKADSTGAWHIVLPELKAGGPYEMKLQASNMITVSDIMVGDVWVCSGQSNMELPMRRVSWVYPDEIANSANNNIRYFHVPREYHFDGPLNDIKSGSWRAADPESVLDFAAIAYFFAKELNDKYQIPIGLINAALGGSPAEAWMSEEALKEFPEHFQELQKFKDDQLIKKIRSTDRERIQGWYELLGQKDEGYRDPHKYWYNPDIDTSDWAWMNIPGYWADTETGHLNGVVWFRKEFHVPSSLAGEKAKLILGRIIDADSVFINGEFVGTTSYQYPPRRYDIPQDLLKAGGNTVVVRIISNAGRGGFATDKPYEIDFEKDTVDLKGRWQYRVGAVMEPLRGETFIRWKPAGLYNAMIAPLLKFSIKGVIWYQGESNADRPDEYARLFPALINNWREKWKENHLPFIYVQLPNFMKPVNQPSESNWALMREAQLKTLSVPNTGMAVAIDVGEWNDIHPLNKKDVGYRLAVAARKVAYGEEDIVYSGPLYQDMDIEGNRVILSFTNTGSGLVAKGGECLRQFAVAGADKHFVWAQAKIENNKVIVWSPEVSIPVAVRYAWADNPEGANLYNREGLPASPFRTDDWGGW